MGTIRCYNLSNGSEIETESPWVPGGHAPSPSASARDRACVRRVAAVRVWKLALSVIFLFVSIRIVSYSSIVSLVSEYELTLSCMIFNFFSAKNIR